MKFEAVQHDSTGYVELASTHISFGIRDSVIAVFALSLIAAVVMRYSGLFISVVDWDESLYALMAERWLEGALPYGAVWDQHSIGLPAVFAAILYAFPKSILALRLSACVAVAVTSTSLYFMARMVDRRLLVPVVAVVLYIGWTARLWGLAANTEIYLNALIAPAMLLLISDVLAPARRSWRTVRVCLAALMFGVALQIKHVAVAETALFFAVLVTSWFGVKTRLSWRGIMAAAACFAAPTLLTVGYFYSHGLAQEYFHAVLDANLVYAANRPPLSEILAAVPRSFLLPIGLAAVGIALIVHRPTRLPIFFAAWVIAAAIDVTLPGQFWPHYFLLIAPPAALLGGIVAARLSEAWPRLPVAVVALGAMVLANPIGIYKDAKKVHAYGDVDVPRVVSDRLGEELASGDSVFVFNYQPVVYFLTDADLPTRHVFPADWSQRFLDVSGLDPVRELEAVFQRHPKFVVFVDNDWMLMGERAFSAFYEHLRGYDKAFELVDRQLLPDPIPVQVYRRKGPLPEG